MPSSVINHFIYDSKSHTLVITFVTGMVYAYQKVPLAVFKMLKAAGSKGRYFNHHIKDKFAFSKLES